MTDGLELVVEQRGGAVWIVVSPESNQRFPDLCPLSRRLRRERNGPRRPRGPVSGGRRWKRSSLSRERRCFMKHRIA